MDRSNQRSSTRIRSSQLGHLIHIGSPEKIIKDLSQPEYGGYCQVAPGQIPAFWACGVTPQLAALKARLPLMITHKVARMFVSDWRDEDFLAT